MKTKLFCHLLLSSFLVFFLCCNRQEKSDDQSQSQQPAQTQTPQQEPSSSSPPANSSESAPAPEQNSGGSTAENTISAPSNSEPAQNSESESAHFRMPAYWENPDAAGSLAPTLDPSSVSPEAQAAYLVAQQKPKLLAQMPCFCYCDRFGHKSLHDCYVSTHAEHCEVCIQEAIEADQLEKQGMTPEEIRKVIVAKHHPPS